MKTELLTAEELGNRLKLKPETIRTWARKGLIPSLHPTTKTLRFDFQSVLSTIDKLPIKKSTSDRKIENAV